MIGGQEGGKIIPYPIWIISFPVFENSFLLGGEEVGEIIPIPVWIIQFPIFKTSSELIGKSLKYFVKEVFLLEVIRE